MKHSWSYEELSELDAGNLGPADDAALRRRIDGDSEARRALEALQTIRLRLSQLGQQNYTERPVDFAERFRPEPEPEPERAPAATRAPRARHRTLLAAVAAGLLLIIGLPLLLHATGSQPEAGTSPEPGSNATNGPSAEAVSVPTGRPDLTRIDLRAPGVPLVSMYFGQLRAIAETIDDESAAQIDPQFLAANPNVCAETVIATGVPGMTGAVYALNLTGWSAAEGAPPQILQEPTRAIHQQTIIPPATVTAGTTLEGAARVQSDAVDTATAPFTLRLATVDGPRQTWTVGGTVSVTCQAHQ